MKQNVLFVVQSMAVGGISTSLINLLERLEAKQEKINVSVLSFAKTPADAALPAFVQLHYAGGRLAPAAISFYDALKSKNPVTIVKRLALMLYVRLVGSETFYRKAFARIQDGKQYDAAISYSNDVPGAYFNQGTNLYVAEYIEAKEKLAWIHTDPIKMGFDKEHCKKLYEKFDRIVCVSRAVKDSFDTLLPCYSHKTEVVYNFFDRDKLLRQAEAYTPQRAAASFIITTVCRIDNASKRVDGILHLCRRLKKEGVTDFCWRLVGDGPDLKQNKKLAKDLDICDVVEFVGEQTNPLPYVKQANLFALYSAYEGYPMVIGEALAVGTYVLTTAYAAAYEQVDENSGQIAASDEEFYQRLKTLILCGIPKGGIK